MVRTTLFMVLPVLGVVGQFAPVLAQDKLKKDASPKEKPTYASIVADRSSTENS